MFERLDPGPILNFSEETLPMMLDSILAAIQDRHRDRNHLSLSQSQVAIAVHEAVIKSHQSAKGSEV